MLTLFIPDLDPAHVRSNDWSEQEGSDNLVNGSPGPPFNTLRVNIDNEKEERKERIKTEKFLMTKMKRTGKKNSSF